MPKSTSSAAVTGLPETSDDKIYALHAKWRRAWDHSDFLADLLEVAEKAKDEKAKATIHELQDMARVEYDAAIDRMSSIESHSHEGLRTKIAVLRATRGIEYEALEKSVLRDVERLRKELAGGADA